MLMAKIISISLNDEILNEIDEIQSKLGFSGRSEVIRAGVRELVSKNSKLDQLAGNVEGVLTVTHCEKYSNEFSKIRHRYHNNIRTQIHHEMSNHVCMEVLIIKGDSKDIKKMYNDFITSKNMIDTRLVIS